MWGLGAVVLTVTLQGLAEKSDRYVFAAGFIVGGAYEYICSVFTELVFGTVFWDYSDMPLNIGGRTNVLFCFFWGVLAVVWIKIVYPPMSKGIESLPPLAGKIAVGNVVMNRVNHPRFPNNIYDVLFQKNQFTPAASGSIYRDPNAESVIAAMLVLDGAQVAPDALFFNAAGARSYASRTRTYVTTIGDHAFYK